MPAPKGNRFWRARAKHGRGTAFKDANHLWESACEYFEWVEDNPLMEAKAFSFQGESWIENIPKMRAMTIEGLCIFLGVNSKYLSQFESDLDLSCQKDKDFSHVINDIREIIKTQKFTGAAADLLNANIIARDLGLSDKKELEHGGTINNVNYSPEDYKKAQDKLKSELDDLD